MTWVYFDFFCRDCELKGCACAPQPYSVVRLEDLTAAITRWHELRGIPECPMTHIELIQDQIVEEQPV